MIALINPNANVEVVKRLDISTPPLGVGYLAAVLREQGFMVRVIDDLVEKLSLDELLKRIRDVHIIGITSTTPTFNAALRYARMIKRNFPDTFIILGGVHVTFMPYDALKNDFVDAVCVGEGEYTLAEAAERLEAERSLEGVKGLVWKDGGRIRDNGLREPIHNLDALPFPAYDLMPIEKYRVLGQKLQQFSMITSRGCPFACRYCSSSFFMGHRLRARSAENIVDEIEWLVNDFNAKQIAFTDDTFTLNKSKVIKICDEMKKRNLDIEWGCTSRVDTINEELLRKMKKSGCSMIYYGVESASPEVLKYYRKRIDLGKVKRAVKLTKKEEIMMMCSFIIGAPYERKEDMKTTLKFAMQLDPDYAQFSVLTPYPGTEIYEEAKQKGLLLSENFDDYTAGKPVLKNSFLSPDEISRFLKFCYLRFYMRPKFILRAIKKKNLGAVIETIRRVIISKSDEEAW